MDYIFKRICKFTIFVTLLCMQKKKGTQGIIEIENPNLVKPKSMKARDVDVSLTFHCWSLHRDFFMVGWKNDAIFLWMQVGKTTELSRRERFATFHLLVV